MSQEKRTAQPNATHRIGRTFSVPVAIILVSAYVTSLFVSPPRSWDPTVRRALSAPRQFVQSFVAVGWRNLGIETPAGTLVDGTFFLLTGVAIPWLVMATLRRGRWNDIGWRCPNRFGWRIFLVAYLLSVPFLIWMVSSPGFGKYYLHQLQAGLFGFIASYFANMFAEHFLFHGIMLAAFRADHRWPEEAPVIESRDRGFKGVLQWIGLAQPTAGVCGGRRVVAWAGLPPGCVTAIVVSGLLFGWVHLGKDARELFLSVPGGMASAYLAYRTNCWLTPFALHLATAGSACALMVLRQP